jgi:hypothetical protein
MIKIALHFGGLPAADGDILRRHVVRAIASGIAKKDDFFISCAQQGHQSTEIYRQTELCGLFILQGTLCFMRCRELSEFVLKCIIL